MTQEVLKKIRALDEAAEKAGGYVLPPEKRHVSPSAEKEFTELRQRSVREKIPMSVLLEREGLLP